MYQMIGIPLNGTLTVVSTENIQITNVKRTHTNQVLELTPVQDVVSFAGFPLRTFHNGLCLYTRLSINQTRRKAKIN